MTAEERLKELYERSSRGLESISGPGKPIFIKPEHIDLIADLVVERLNKKGEQTDGNGTRVITTD